MDECKPLVRGDDSSERTKWGAHIMLHSPGDETSVGRISYVECHLCGKGVALLHFPAQHEPFLSPGVSRKSA